MASHGLPRPATAVHRTEEEVREEQRQIQEYRDLEDLIRAKIAERQYTVEVLELTSKLLKKNPEYYTIWNVRRRLLIHGFFSEPSHLSSPSTESPSISQTATTTASSASSSSSPANISAAQTTTPHIPASRTLGKNGTTLDIISADLAWLVPIMISYPKCYWIWNYRFWLLQQANERLEPDIARQLWNGELKLVGKMLVRDTRNFHGWGYRRKVVSQLESAALHGSSMAEGEFEYTTKMITSPKGLSNFSAFHRRSKIIPKLLDERGADDQARRIFLEEEFDLIISAMYTDSYPYAQSAWFYYQFLMTTLTDHVGHATITPNFTNKERVEFVTRQLADLKEMLEGAEDNKWIYNALIEYSLALCEMEERRPRPDEKQDCIFWLIELRKLDPLRKGRWDDLEVFLGNSHAPLTTE